MVVRIGGSALILGERIEIAAAHGHSGIILKMLLQKRNKALGGADKAVIILGMHLDGLVFQNVNAPFSLLDALIGTKLDDKPR